MTHNRHSAQCQWARGLASAGILTKNTTTPTCLDEAVTAGCPLCCLVSDAIQTYLNGCEPKLEPPAKIEIWHSKNELLTRLVWDDGLAIKLEVFHEEGERDTF